EVGSRFDAGQTEGRQNLQNGDFSGGHGSGFGHGAAWLGDAVAAETAGKRNQRTLRGHVALSGRVLWKRILWSEFRPDLWRSNRYHRWAPFDQCCEHGSGGDDWVDLHAGT